MSADAAAAELLLFRRRTLKCEVGGCADYAIAALIYDIRDDGSRVLMYRCGRHIGIGALSVVELNARADTAMHGGVVER